MIFFLLDFSRKHFMNAFIVPNEKRFFAAQKSRRNKKKIHTKREQKEKERKKNWKNEEDCCKWMRRKYSTRTPFKFQRCFRYLVSVSLTFFSFQDAIWHDFARSTIKAHEIRTIIIYRFVVFVFSSLICRRWSNTTMRLWIRLPHRSVIQK